MLARCSAMISIPLGAVTLFVWIAAMAASPAQAQAIKEIAPAQRTMKIQVLGPGDKPLAGAQIHAGVWTKEPFKANRDYVCDESGKTTVELPGEIEILRLWAKFDGHVPLFAQWWPSMEENPRPIPEEYTFRLTTGSVIGGIVKNDAGEPIEGAKVQVMLVNRYDDGVLRERPVPNTWLAYGDAARTTNAEGRWQLENVPAGDDVEVKLMLGHPKYISDYAWGEMQLRQDVTMTSLRDQGATIVMSRGISVTGTVVNAEGKPISNAVVVWGDDPYSQQGTQEVRTNAEGLFEFPPLPAEPLWVTAIAPGFGPAEKRLDLKSDDPKVRFELREGRTVRIRFVDEAGEAIPEVFVAIVGWRGSKALYNYKHPNVLDTTIPRQADKRGMFEWTWAPEDEVLYSFYKEGFRGVHERGISAGDHVLTLKR